MLSTPCPDCHSKKSVKIDLNLDILYRSLYSHPGHSESGIGSFSKLRKWLCVCLVYFIDPHWGWCLGEAALRAAHM
jgi:hypothetical protein